jgi:hypothetical protein
MIWFWGIWVWEASLGAAELFGAGAWARETPEKMTRAAAKAVILIRTKTFAEYTSGRNQCPWASKKVSSCIYTRIQISKKAARNVLNTAPKTV